MSGSEPTKARKPAAFRLDDSKVHLSDDDLREPAADEAIVARSAIEEDEIRLPRDASDPKPGFGFGKWLMAGLAGLVSLAIGLAVDSLIRDLFARTDWLGWLGVGLAAIAALGLLGLVLRDGGLMAVVGLVLGGLGGLLLTRFLQRLLYEVQPLDPLTFAAVGVLLLAVALIAALIPGRLATRTAPAEVLYSE